MKTCETLMVRENYFGNDYWLSDDEGVFRVSDIDGAVAATVDTYPDSPFFTILDIDTDMVYEMADGSVVTLGDYLEGSVLITDRGAFNC